MTYYTPPVNQGQIVEVSYAGAGDAGLVERSTDRSNRSVTYRIAGWSSRLIRWWNKEGPWNTRPPPARWSKVTAETLAKILERAM